MEKTWRWFGPADKVTPEMMRQIGVEGVVTALHHLAPGELWTVEDIRAVQARLAAAALHWSVVESLPVSEEIKYAGPRRDALIDTYIRSLENLGRCGIHTVCYNFMPVIDWVRTDLERPLPDGSRRTAPVWAVPILARAGCHVGRTLKFMETDSWECGGMNWTDGFEREFAREMGYDPVPYLAVLAGIGVPPGDGHGEGEPLPVVGMAEHGPLRRIQPGIVRRHVIFPLDVGKQLPRRHGFT